MNGRPRYSSGARRGTARAASLADVAARTRGVVPTGRAGPRRRRGQDASGHVCADASSGQSRRSSTRSAPATAEPRPTPTTCSTSPTPISAARRGPVSRQVAADLRGARRLRRTGADVRQPLRRCPLRGAMGRGARTRPQVLRCPAALRRRDGVGDVALQRRRSTPGPGSVRSSRRDARERTPHVARSWLLARGRRGNGFTRADRPALAARTSSR